MKLLSVNVGQPKVANVEGRPVETGIFKEPVAGSVAAGMFNLDGDGQADLSVHGGRDKAVYAYSWQNVLFWRQTLGRHDIRAVRFLASPVREKARGVISKCPRQRSAVSSPLS